MLTVAAVVGADDFPGFRYGQWRRGPTYGAQVTAVLRGILGLPGCRQHSAEQACCALGAGIHGSLICLLVISQAWQGGALCRRRSAGPFVVPGHGGGVGWGGGVSASPPAAPMSGAPGRRG